MSSSAENFDKRVERGTTVGFFPHKLDPCFPKEHSRYRIINQNVIKQFYRTIPNFGTIFKSTNRKIIYEYELTLEEKTDKQTKLSRKVVEGQNTNTEEM